MRLLGIETAAFAGGVALVEDGRVVAEYTLDAGKGGHSRWLVPAIQELLEAAGWSGDSLDALAVNRGPGSFTGIRIGVATAQGLAYGWDRPLWGVEGLEALAWQAVGSASAGAGNAGAPQSPRRVVLSLIDARHGNVYAAAYRTDGRTDGLILEPLVAAAAWAVEDFLEAVEQALENLRENYPDNGSYLTPSAGEAREMPDVALHLAGDGGVVFESIIRERFPAVVPVPLDGDRLRAATVARWAALKHAGLQPGSHSGQAAGADRRIRRQAQAVWPLYLKKSEAERKWRQTPSP